MIMNKELSIEEKAKAYDKAIERAKQHCADYVVETIFPELKESEDEKIRKALIVYLKSILSNKKYGDKFIEDWIVWLEKQGEQQDVSIQINPSEYINDMGGNGCYLKNTTQASAWSEEDDEHLERILKELENQRQRPLNSPYLDKIESDYNWLKSLKYRVQPQNTWKPNSLQMQALYEETLKSDRIKDIRLVSLYNDLKKLKE